MQSPPSPQYDGNIPSSNCSTVTTPHTESSVVQPSLDVSSCQPLPSSHDCMEGTSTAFSPSERSVQLEGISVHCVVIVFIDVSGPVFMSPEPVIGKSMHSLLLNECTLIIFRTYVNLMSDDELADDELAADDDQEQEMIRQAIEESLKEM